MRKHGMAVMAALGAALAAEAHLGPMSVKGGETFKAGESIQVKFNVSVQHPPNKFEFLLSTNGGTTFQPIETKEIPGEGDRTYVWSVPNSPSPTAQFKICQWSGQNACAYESVSTNFSITGATSVRSVNPVSAGTLSFDAATRSLAVSFGLHQEERVQVSAFDTQGRLVATLLEGRYAAGSHSLSVFSNRLDAFGPLVFHLRVGEVVRLQKMARP